ncbi:hypothetical protein [Allomesorhizobium camelthorni]|uniref:Uncharacterized protein n=1 Tax=Allomesorhizobium camelthorni TaxID=475069 RepID=A0A6G4WNG9_9HYPH|nr:hypothetical protein [Mesorhizobium camelthorni]
MSLHLHLSTARIGSSDPQHDRLRIFQDSSPLRKADKGIARHAHWLKPTMREGLFHGSGCGDPPAILQKIDRVPEIGDLLHHVGSVLEGIALKVRQTTVRANKQ